MAFFIEFTSYLAGFFDLREGFYAIFGRFKEKASHLILDFHSSINFDKRLYKYVIMGSIAHVRGLGKQGIISNEEAKLIEKTLRDILKDIEDGKIQFSIEYEDIHMNIEKILIDRIGDTGKNYILEEVEMTK